MVAQVELNLPAFSVTVNTCDPASASESLSAFKWLQQCFHPVKGSVEQHTRAQAHGNQLQKKEAERQDEPVGKRRVLG
jgi:hypothetical protein